MRHLLVGVDPQAHSAVAVDSLRAAVRLLLGVSGVTERAGAVTIELAVSRDALLAQGADDDALRQLLAAGFIEEVAGNRPGADAASARFGPAPLLRLTERGVAFACGLLYGLPDEKPVERPCWHGEDGELYWRGVCIKRYEHEAVNQRLLLDAFERAGWPRRLRDPFTPEEGVDARTRLANTVRSLKDGQKPLCIVFSMDGTGCGVRWQAVE